MRKMILTPALLLLPLTLTLSPMAPAAAATSDIVNVAPATRAADAQQLLDLINAHRSSYGLAPVKYSASLSAIPQTQSDRLVEQEVINHRDDFWTNPSVAGFNAVGEIHALSYRVSVPELMGFWKSSPSHNRILIDPRMTVIGIGLTYTNGSLANTKQPWKLVGTVASYGYPVGKGPADASTTVTGVLLPTTAPAPVQVPAPGPAPALVPVPAPVPAPAAPPNPAPPVAPVVQPVSSPFSDVSTSHVFTEEITWMHARGISTGWRLADGTSVYRPSWNVTRGQMAAFLYRQAGSPAYTAPEVSPFTDVSTTLPFYKEISWLAESGVSTGWQAADGTRSFKPSQEISRGQMAAFLYRLAGNPAYTAPAASPFTDVRATQTFYKEMAWLQERGIANGWSDGTYRAGAPVERGVMAAFLHRYDRLPN